MDSLDEKLRQLRELHELTFSAITLLERADLVLSRIKEERLDKYFDPIDNATFRTISGNILVDIDKLYDLHNTALQIIRSIRFPKATTIATGEYTNPDYIKTNE